MKQFKQRTAVEKNKELRRRTTRRDHGNGNGNGNGGNLIVGTNTTGGGGDGSGGGGDGGDDGIGNAFAGMAEEDLKKVMEESLVTTIVATCEMYKCVCWC